jgi:NADH dehydrogenase/NADH:ubiquinone oxidoreductase subunit G
MQLTINGIPVTCQDGKTILEAAQENGITIPTLCYIKDCLPVGACRVCVVEVEGSRALVGACHTPVTNGMIILTESPKVLMARRTIIELMLGSHPDNCLVCDKANRCELRRMAADNGIGLSRFRIKKHYYPIEEDNPYITRDMSKCILCRRCVTACKNLKKQNIFSVAYRGFNSKVICGFDQPIGSEETCHDCDTCISVCPTGALCKPINRNEQKKGAALYIKG